ncbi:MAG: SAM-dependent methyltransferase [Eubacteriales bacterium]|nr:SAM-dependent methyltransferase [Eubacteriales bacterium]
MNTEKSLHSLWEELFTEDRLVRMVISNPKKRSQPVRKLILRPIELQGHLRFQCEYHFLKKVTHQNLTPEECPPFVDGQLHAGFRQVDIFTTNEDIQVLAADPARPRITRRGAKRQRPQLAHNRIKLRIIPEGEPCDFLHALGVMDARGNVLKAHYDKYRQINRYLEIINDVKGMLPQDHPAEIVDFGCGKAYLTFALYHYLHDVCGMPIHVTGLDLKEDVIAFCSETATRLGYEDLRFRAGDIATYEGADADMVVSLHACDTATDFALCNAVRWHSKVILSVPCCQHELFSQIRHPILDHMLSHGILRDRFTEILTDGLRAEKLEAAGYDVSLIEFTSLEHTARNIMIKAVRGAQRDPVKAKKAESRYQALCQMFHVQPAIEALPADD